MYTTTQDILTLIISGACYDSIKTTGILGLEYAKDKLKKVIPFLDDEIETINNEIQMVSCDISENELKEYILKNQVIQKILVDFEKREPKATKKIIESFNKNKDTEFNLSLDKEYVIKNSFNDNQNCKINIR
jgi:hypothetical protein